MSLSQKALCCWARPCLTGANWVGGLRFVQLVMLIWIFCHHYRISKSSSLSRFQTFIFQEVLSSWSISWCFALRRHQVDQGLKVCSYWHQNVPSLYWISENLRFWTRPSSFTIYGPFCQSFEPENRISWIPYLKDLMAHLRKWTYLYVGSEFYLF